MSPGALGPRRSRPARCSAVSARRTIWSRLRAHAASLPPGDLRFGTELVDFRQDADHVTATLRDARGDTRVRARYLIAADGALA